MARETGNADVLSSGGGLFRRGGSAPSVRKMDTPAFVVCVTDGVPDDPQAATDIIRRLSYQAVFLRFLFVGNDASGWNYLESLDDDIPVGVPFEQGGRLIDNVDAKKMSKLGKDDDSFYARRCSTVTTTWLPPGELISISISSTRWPEDIAFRRISSGPQL
ncbi:MAG: VWA domain-containing protein [Candidatus Saccharimonadales bacterium]